MEENIWYEILDGLDWDAIDRDVQESLEEDRVFDELHEYFDNDSFDYKRSYLRKYRRTYPKNTDRTIIDAATEQMLESHEGGVELDVADALRFAKNKKPLSAEEIVKILADAGANDDHFIDMLTDDFDDGKFGTVKSEQARKRASWMTRYADMAARNKDVLILALPTFDPEQDWTYVKLAFFGENLNPAEQYALKSLIQTADRSWMKEEHGVAVAFFQIFNIWADFYISPEKEKTRDI